MPLRESHVFQDNVRNELNEASKSSAVYIVELFRADSAENRIASSPSKVIITGA